MLYAFAVTVEKKMFNGFKSSPKVKGGHISIKILSPQSVLLLIFGPYSIGFQWFGQESLWHKIDANPIRDNICIII